MSALTYYGPVKASCILSTGKAVYLRVGAAYHDAENRLVVKLESLPLPHQNWNGFLNIYEGDKSE